MGSASGQEKASALLAAMPADWRAVLQPRVAASHWAALEAFLDDEYASGEVYPPRDQLFTALHLTPFAAVRVLWLGQDPYHEEGQAYGLAFSVPDEIATPPSLRNIFKEYAADLALPLPSTHRLEPWARQGVLLINAVLSVRAGQAASHQGRGWEAISDAIIDALVSRPEPLVFVLLGRVAQRKKERIEPGRHQLVEAAHPSPLSAHRGFFGSRIFSRINVSLAHLSHQSIDWRLP
jgi:uracil-DNA glycosylase